MLKFRNKFYIRKINKSKVTVTIYNVEPENIIVFEDDYSKLSYINTPRECTLAITQYKMQEY